ncbi:carbohydrate-binding protein [Aquimarina sp. MMG016]|uniref:carbohydrate-binding protein n=1 Tax=Aquimarina sp. MMG016 TaxID=2822690 RepID=UPI001B3A4700|nr:carbohydrate-binding protein [Aquimarina sp. MMG016]MBQ4820415.1 family 16 glycosylhydrolase [Aquimarina sp. MMG016]
MKTIKTLLFFTFFMMLSPVATSQSWNLVWQDEFTNGISPDWVFETGNGSSGWGNNELQFYRRENATIENGSLVITAKKENFGGYGYTSARMKTQGRRKFKYGKIEARIALPSGQGLWPAFWMLGSDISAVGWPACGEIDIMEHVNNEPDVHGTIHWQDNNNNYASYGGHTAVNVNDYHVYSIEWNENNIRWFIDGTEYHIVDISNGVNGTSEFHNDYFLLLNMAVGGNWPGFSVDESRLPARMYVDYVRVYQASANPPPTGVAIIYEHCSYGGYAIGLGEGNYTRTQLIGLGIKDDDISSVKVQSGYQTTLYFDDNFTGTSVTKTIDDSCLVDDGFNDQVTSIIISKSNGGSSTFIEAENYTSMFGVQNENCSEGGQNVGYIDTGDWMAYNNINFPTSGSYTIEYRVASTINGAKLSTDINAGATVLGQVNIPNTGGWQNWTTVSHIVNVNAGTYPLGIYAASGGWNINWIKITKQNNARSFDSASTYSTKPDEERKRISTTSIYPNPFTDIIQFNFDTDNANIIVFDALGRKVMTSKYIKSGKSIDLSYLEKGMYSITIEKDGVKEIKYIIKQ